MAGSLSLNSAFLALVLVCGSRICAGASLCTVAEMAEENLKKLGVANNEYALNLYKRLTAGSSENVFFSPLSLSTAMAMLYYGAKGGTANELRKVLGYERAELADEQVHSAFHQLLTEKLRSEDPKAYVLNSANSILLDKNFGVLSDYRARIRELYEASVQVRDFSAEGGQVVQEVNNFVKTSTNGKIDRLLDELDPSALLIILNAVYFKGTWKTQFDARITFPQTFYNKGLESEAKKIPMMHLEAHFPYANLGDYHALELPYKGENISMLILLPEQRDGLAALESSLTLEKLTDIRKELDRSKVIVSLPKFKLEYSREMSEDIRALGANKIFNPQADFSGMTTGSNVFVSQVLHKAVVEVNEEGSEAAAVTGIISNRMGIIEDTPEFNADHPFLFAIVDNRNDMILFSGRVNTL